MPSVSGVTRCGVTYVVLVELSHGEHIASHQTTPYINDQTHIQINCRSGSGVVVIQISCVVRPVVL